IDSTFALADAQAAHERAARGHIQGKIVLTVARNEPFHRRVRRGLLRRWHGSPPRVVVRPVLFWASPALTLGAVASALLPDGRIPVVFFEWFLCVFPGAWVLAATVVAALADYVTGYVVLRRSVPSRPSMFDQSNGTNGVEGTE
ncbi:hypothetical protein ABZU45_38475, partial [Streptomyces avermitilis]|uniref:hypothetical protein n=1 Tax=Streptomyces avermitilis TaxID=33903 RepID=UPI0033BC9498